MAKGDTKTNQYLDIAANGTRADLPSDTCCETRSQTLIREVAERIMDVEDEVEELKNNPDVVDIVDTYADLQNYPTSGLTDKDIVRVIADETKGGLSSYYRWNSPNPGWNFVGVIPGGDGIKELSSADYNYPTTNPDRVALWLLDNGLYTAPAGVMVAASTTSYPWYNTSDKTILVGGSDTVKGIYTFLNGKTDVVTTQVSDGTEADEYTLLKSTQVLQTTGQSTTDTMSQKAITDAIAGGGGGGTNDFNQLINRPEYDGATMTGNTNIPKVPTATSELTNDSGFITSSALPTVNDATLTITQNGTTVGTFTANDSDNATVALTDTTYTAGNGLDLTGTEFSVDTTTIQPKLTAGSNVTIDANNEISATDTTYSNFVGTDGTAAGTAGLVPAPATTDAGKFLKADGTWDTVGGGSGPTVVQTTGTSTTDVMSQKAASDMVYVPGYDPVTTPSTWAIGLGKYTYIAAGPSFTVGRADSGNFRTRTYNNLAINILGGDNIGQGSITLGAGSHNKTGDSWNIVIGADATTGGHSRNNVVLGYGAVSADSANGAIALGSYSSATYTGEMNIGSSNTSYGYNSSNYRLLSGVYDPQSAHDAATKGYVDGTTETYTIATSDWSALSASSPYDYQATVTATYTIGANTIAELLNDSPVDFANHGFAIGSISSQSVTIYSIGQPSASVSLKVNYKG